MFFKKNAESFNVWYFSSIVTHFHQEFVERQVNCIYNLFEIKIQQHIHHFFSDSNQTFGISNKANLNYVFYLYHRT